MIKVSKAGKMPCPSWSLQARETCPGSIDQKTKQILPVCKSCYATRGNYGFPDVKASRDHNREDWKRPEFVSDMVKFLNDYRFFRWFDSGDVYCAPLAEKIYQIIQLTPWCNHWLPTKSYTIPKIRKVLDKIAALPNVVVRFSSPSITGEFQPGLHGSTVYKKNTNPPLDTVGCEAYTRQGKCGDCRACWSKDNKVIAYPYH